MKPNNIKSKINTIVGSIGAFIGIFVFIAYIPQIIANISGSKGQPWQPAMAAFSCLIWVIYGWTKEPKKYSKYFWRYSGISRFYDSPLVKGKYAKLSPKQFQKD